MFWTPLNPITVNAVLWLLELSPLHMHCPSPILFYCCSCRNISVISMQVCNDIDECASVDNGGCIPNSYCHNTMVRYLQSFTLTVNLPTFYSLFAHWIEQATFSGFVLLWRVHVWFHWRPNKWLHADLRFRIWLCWSCSSHEQAVWEWSAQPLRH